MFDGFSEDFLLVITTIGSLCDVGVILGTTISLYLFYSKTRTRLQNVEVSEEKIDILVSETSDLLM